MKKFFSFALLLVAVMCLQGCGEKKSGFTMWQLPTCIDQLCSQNYVFKTDKGRIIVYDGGEGRENLYTRGFLAAMGNEVDTWIVSHPHDDHFGALQSILREPKGLKIKKIIYSRVAEENIPLDGGRDVDLCRIFYHVIDSIKAHTDIEVVDLQQPGDVWKFDGMNVKVLAVVNPSCPAYNDNSIVLRVWDNRKSVVLLGDAGEPEGKILLNSPYRDDLNCDYLQIGHHGQGTMHEDFYKQVDFKVALWSISKDIWTKDHNGHFLRRKWIIDDKGIKENHVAWMGAWKLD